MVKMRDIPHYEQLYNTCGLSSLLMLAMPEENKLQYLLDDICKLIGVSTEFNKALNWQLACGYLLLKMSFNRVLSYQLRKVFNYDYGTFKIILKDQIAQKIALYTKKQDTKKLTCLNMFLNRRVIRKDTLRIFMDDMKTNLELKMLARFFGGIFIPNPNSMDGTGCYTFPKRTKKDVKFLRQLIDDGLMLGLFNHWLPIKDIYKDNDNNDFILTVNDPLKSQERILFSNLTDHHRFYSYKFDPKLQEEMDEFVRRALNLRKSPKIP